MPVIIYKQFSRRNRIKAIILLMLILCPVILVITMREFAASNASDAEKPHLLLQDALAAMHNNHTLLYMEILEKGEGYILSFKGKKVGEKSLSGVLSDYDLEIYQNRRGNLYVKDLVSGLWTDVNDLGLNGLKDFFINPFELLSCYQEQFKEAAFSSSEEKEENRVIKLPLPPDIFLPLVDLPIQEPCLICYLFIDKESLFINRITFILSENKQQRELIKRTFFFRETGEDFC